MKEKQEEQGPNNIRPIRVRGEFLNVLDDVQCCLKRMHKRRWITSAYLVGSAARRVPASLEHNGEYLQLSDVDIVVFVDKGLHGKYLKAIRADLKNSRSATWGVYKTIHIGLRIRPDNEVEYKALESASWGEMLHDGHLLAGRALVEQKDRRISRDSILENTLSKLALSSLGLMRQAARGWDTRTSVDFCRHASSAAVKISILNVLAHKDEEVLRETLAREVWVDRAEVLWKSSILRERIPRLAQLKEQPVLVTHTEGKEFIATMVEATREICEQLELGVTDADALNMSMRRHKKLARAAPHIIALGSKLSNTSEAFAKSVFQNDMQRRWLLETIMLVSPNLRSHS